LNDPLKNLLVILLLGAAFQLVSLESNAQFWAKGRVYLDRNADGALDRFDFPQPAVRVHIFRDLDSDGVIDGSDTLVATRITNGDGEYEIRISEGKLLNIRVSANNDDAEEDTDDDSMSRNSTDLEMIEDGAVDQIIGVRFRNVPIANSQTVN